MCSADMFKVFLYVPLVSVKCSSTVNVCCVVVCVFRTYSQLRRATHSVFAVFFLSTSKGQFAIALYIHRCCNIPPFANVIRRIVHYHLQLVALLVVFFWFPALSVRPPRAAHWLLVVPQVHKILRTSASQVVSNSLFCEKASNRGEKKHWHGTQKRRKNRVVYISSRRSYLRNVQTYSRTLMYNIPSTVQHSKG